MAEQNPTDTHRVTPREVEPDSKTPGGAPQRERATGHDRGLRPEPVVEEADGGDMAGIAGGGIDRNVSGLGGDPHKR